MGGYNTQQSTVQRSRYISRYGESIKTAENHLFSQLHEATRQMNHADKKALVDPAENEVTSTTPEAATHSGPPAFADDDDYVSL